MINMPEFGPLAGVKVVISGVAIAGPFAATLMGDYGADVTFIENSAAIDMLRPESYFQHAHRNQKAIALNVPTAEGKEIFMKLMKDTDIFIENSKAGQWAKWGITDELLWSINPKLIIAHASGFGQTGDPKYLSRGSWDAIGQAFGGMMYMNGLPEPEIPMISSPYVCDYYTAIYTSWACLAAYIKMLKTGKGDSIDIAQYEVLVYSMADAVMNYYNRGKEIKRAGYENPKYGAWKVYNCKDGRVYLAPAGIKAGSKGLDFLGIKRGTEDFPEGIQMFPAGSKAAKEVAAKLTEYCKNHTVAEAEEELNSVGLLCSPIMTHPMMAENSHYKAREVLTDWLDADGNKIKGPNTVLKFKNNPGKVWRGAPKYGMDNEIVLASLGYSKEDIAKFYDNKILAKNK